jgi:hypothetical protein
MSERAIHEPMKPVPPRTSTFKIGPFRLGLYAGRAVWTILFGKYSAKRKSDGAKDAKMRDDYRCFLIFELHELGICDASIPLNLGQEPYVLLWSLKQYSLPMIS